MARYRIGNRYLSQDEYDYEMDWKLICGFFLAGAVITGWLIHTYLVNPHWHQAIRFFVTTVPAFAVGWLLVKIRYYIMMLMALAVALFIVALVIGIIVSLV
ncbi:hypothetical protein [Pantoea ananatis]|uniref:hypothetical protein n=1 Tax=Pantoea ananas TaxID=553 RepID=UPI000FEC2CE8|nr:hypothetical protein [Pantoea ananatis]QAB32613.1 hypothetical protein EPK90_22945 [Pantoea ananatis]